MTTREAISLTRQEARKNTGEIRDALNICAVITERHAERNRRNKQRWKRYADARAVSAKKDKENQ